MSDHIIFSGKSDMKGRNGYTKLGSADSFCSSNETLGRTRWISFYSPRPRGGVGTALLELNREDFNQLKAWISSMEFDDTHKL